MPLPDSMPYCVVYMVAAHLAASTSADVALSVTQNVGYKIIYHNICGWHELTKTLVCEI